MRQWVKLWSDLLCHAPMSRLPVASRWAWVACLLAADGLDAAEPGWIDLGAADLARLAALPIEDARRALDDLVRIGCLEVAEGGYLVRNYRKRQGKPSDAPTAAAARQRLSRARHAPPSRAPVTPPGHASGSRPTVTPGREEKRREEIPLNPPTPNGVTRRETAGQQPTSERGETAGTPLDCAVQSEASQAPTPDTTDGVPPGVPPRTWSIVASVADALAAPVDADQLARDVAGIVAAVPPAEADAAAAALATEVAVHGAEAVAGERGVAAAYSAALAARRAALAGAGGAPRPPTAPGRRGRSQGAADTAARAEALRREGAASIAARETSEGQARMEAVRERMRALGIAGPLPAALEAPAGPEAPPPPPPAPAAPTTPEGAEVAPDVPW